MALQTTLDKPKLLEMYRTMRTIRDFEERLSAEFAAGNVPGFVHLYIGQEAVATGVCGALEPTDSITSTHRGHGHCIAKGGDMKKMMAELFGKEEGYGHGRSGSMHLTDVGIGILGANGIVAAGTGIAAGAGMKPWIEGGNDVAVSFFGDNAMNEGLIHEAMNMAALYKLPVVFVCENNGFGQFTPLAKHTNLRTLADRASGYHIPATSVDGNDVVAVYEAAREATARAREGDGPTMIECKTYRLHGHYEGDYYPYRTQEEVEEWRQRCPVATFRTKLTDEGVASPDELDDIDSDVQRAIEEAVEFAKAGREPDPQTVLRDIYVEDDVETTAQGEPGEPEEIPLAMAVKGALAEEMRRDPRVFCMGEDIQTGIFGVTMGLVEEFGDKRMVDTPISENGFVSAGVGAAMVGMRPVVEVEFSDFVTCCMDPIVNQAAKIRYMTGGQAKVPLVIRLITGAGVQAAAQHSQSLEALFMHIPGLKICVPSNGADAKGLLKTAIRSDNPVLFFEHKVMYFQSAPVPSGDYTIPFGVAAVPREGSDVTIVAVLAMVPKALAVAERLAQEGISCEVIDPRTLVPLDKETILGSVRKTGRLVVAEEGCITGGVGAEIAALVAGEAFDDLDGPIQRVAAPDTPIPFAPNLESAVLPDEARIEAAVRSFFA